MSAVMSAFTGGVGFLGGVGFIAPGPSSFELPPIVGGVTKPMVLIFLGVVVAAGFLIVTSRQAAVVPGRLQFAGEAVYGFVRNNVVRDTIGSEQFRKFLPLLVALFFFIWVNNLFAVIPGIQYPPMARIGYVIPLALLAWGVYNAIGIRKHGFFGYLKHSTVPGGVPLGVLPLVIPLEFMSNILVRPVTLGLRLFANMFAGHLLILLFSLGAEYLLLNVTPLVGIPGGILSFTMGIMISFLELLILTLQAYIFTFLTAMYIAGALSEEH